jgi:hypothetical protein
MFKIRQEQFDVFKPVAEEAFTRRLASFVRERHPRAVVRLPDKTTAVRHLDDETLNGLVRVGIARARSYGLESESSLAAFVVTMFLMAPNFDAHPLVRRVLKDEKVKEDAKFNRLLQAVSAGNLKVVKDAYDPQAWRGEAEGGR